MTIILTTAALDDYPDILELNNNAFPHVSIINEVDLSTLATQSFYFIVARDNVAINDKIAGFLLSLPAGQPYKSQNYRWFSKRYDRFVYIDRIVVAPNYIGQGIGAQLYDELESLGKTYASLLSCEVNLRPPNPNSIAFHKKIGFHEVGQQETNEGENLVSLMCKDLAIEELMDP
jgi:hypothetical protein